jgi:hypothetical protein
MDLVMDDFMTAAGNSSVIIDIETSPAWMWSDAGPKNTETCASDTSIELPVGTRTRCPFYGNVSVPRDPTWKEIAEYYNHVAQWYTNGGFTDPNTGKAYTSGHHYKIDYWEILNEVKNPREHGMDSHTVIDFYDVQANALAAATKIDGSPVASKLMGTSFCCFSGNGKGSVQDYIGNFLNRSNHHPQNVQLDALSFHIYAGCDNNTAAGMEAIFPKTDSQKFTHLKKIAEAATNQSFRGEMHLTESGIYCNSPKSCGANDYTCWYRDFEPLYWVASAGQWLYQFLTYAEAVELTSVAQSQIIGYPYKYDGLSGEWPSGTMVDWDTAGLCVK